ncbi:MAG: DNA polymerase IV [Lentisphaerae bacterium]|nr:DNA polymerase IV [Lentisphaerota bacterium]
MRKIIHIDMDAFFASVEQRDRPELRGAPVLVGGAPQRRGVVSTCSYEARKYGIHSAMPTRTALRLCPQAVLIEPDFRRYTAASRLIREEFFALTDLVEPVSIDEAYLDISNCCSTLEEAAEIARKLQARIYEKCQLTASAGVSYNKFLAKCASDFRKPAGLTLITPETVQDFLDPFPVEKFHGIGKVSAKKLRSINIKCGSDLRKLPLETLKNIFGKAGVFYYGIVRGVDDRPVETEYDPKSISREVTLYEDCTDVRKLRILLKTLARRVARRAENSGFVGQSVFIKLKYDDFQTVTRSVLLDAPCVTGTDIGNAAVQLLQKTEAGKRPVRLIGVGISHRYTPAETEQLNLPFNK